MRNACTKTFVRYFSNLIAPKICIVGAGPAGFYAAQHLAKKLNAVEIDIYERYPVPFGLVRFGVAPDHPEVKNVIHTFTKTAENCKVRFIGNVTLGTDVSLKQLREAYHIVLLAYGADKSRVLNIPGEHLSNVIPAKNIVGWYNGIPSDSNLKLDLSGPSVAIFGQGNVAIDVARILLTPVDLLRATDISQHALELLSKSNVQEVHLIGRRGPLQAAYTIKELREMLKLSNCQTCWHANDFEGMSDIVPTLPRPKKRIMELMLKSLSENKGSSVKKFKPTFFKSPIEIIGSTKVEQVKLGINSLLGDDIFKQKPVLTNKTEILKCDLVVTSIGYESVKVDEDIPFDNHAGVIKNRGGKICDGLYVIGWLATGPTGVILTTMSNAFSTAELICSDLSEMNVSADKLGYGALGIVLKQNNVQVVTWKDWLKIDAFEQKKGEKVGKPREKLTDIKKMLEITADFGNHGRTLAQTV